jgi:tRNA threonylcarbamoyladenosine biosynthesis protein TsaE
VTAVPPADLVLPGPVVTSCRGRLPGGCSGTLGEPPRPSTPAWTVLARTTSVDDTRAFAGALATLVRPGDVILLSGEMGAGKTAFTQGLGASLGVTERITSPTFTIAQTYEGGRLRLHHLDVYRLEHLHEALDIGLAEMVDDGAVVVIEWGDAVVPVLPADFLEIRIGFAPLDDDEASGDRREWQLRPVGAGWKARADALRATLERWEATT